MPGRGPRLQGASRLPNDENDRRKRAGRLALAANQGLSNLKEPSNTFVNVLGAWNPARGGLIVFSRSCNMNLLYDVDVSVDEPDGIAATTGYGDGTTIVAKATASTVIAFLWNVAPGIRTVTASKDGQTIAEELVVVKADAITYMNWFAPRSGSPVGL